MNYIKWIVRIGQVLVILNGLIWLVAGIAGLMRAFTPSGIPFWVLLVMSIGMIGYGGILLGLGIGLGLRQPVFYYAALIMVALAAVLSIFDDFGLADFLAVLPAIVTVIYLVVNKKTMCDGFVTNPRPD